VRWPSLLVGFAIVAAVAAVALGLSEEREIWDLARKARPAWLLAAVLAQAGTYLAQAQIWRRVAAAAGAAVPLRLASELSLAKLFVDQAIPTSGISGSLLFAKALELRGIPRPVLMAAVSVNLSSYFAAYVICMLVALVTARLEGHAESLVLITGAAFIVASTLFAAALLALSGRAGGAVARRAARLRPLASGARLLAEAERRL
jgi:Mg2+-importing ATPase